MTMLACMTATLSAVAQNQAIGGMLSRILPNNGDAEKFEYTIDEQPAQAGDYFRLKCDG